MSQTRTVDCRGLACPQPVIETRQALAADPSTFVVIVDNEGSSVNVRRFAESRGAHVTVARDGDDYHLTIGPGDGAAAGEEPPIRCQTSPPGQTVVYIASEGMGRGDDELGGILMAAFLDTLSQFKGEISHAILVNSGARLAVEGSAVLEQLRQLEEVGVQILVCGTCLNHFGLADRLAVGSVSNMYAIIESMTRAGRIIRP